MTDTLRLIGPSDNLHAPASGVLVVLGTGGTIAGVNQHPGSRAYRAAQLPVEQLLQDLGVGDAGGLHAHGGCWQVESQQVAQVDSKDMCWAVWRVLLQALQQHLSRPEVRAVVITHGTDTLEETALLLHALLPAFTARSCQMKPVVLTAAMRPATAPDADGPRNLADALVLGAWAAQQQRTGVVAVMGGHVWAGIHVRKAHSWDMDAFDGGGASPLAMVSNGEVTLLSSDWPQPLGWLSACRNRSDPDSTKLLSDWAKNLPELLPQVEVLMAHADARAQLLQGLLQDTSLRGLVLAGTGHGTWPAAWDEALRWAHARGVVIWRSSRVARGGVQEEPTGSTLAWPAAGNLTAAQARLLLSLALWCCPDKALHPAELMCPLDQFAQGI